MIEEAIGNVLVHGIPASLRGSVVAPLFRFGLMIGAAVTELVLLIALEMRSQSNRSQVMVFTCQKQQPQLQRELERAEGQLRVSNPLKL